MNSQTAEALLTRLFRESGYVRTANAARKKEGSDSYKKGSEVRIVLETDREVGDVRRALEALDFKPGRVFRKHSRLVVPVYGRPAVDWFRGHA